MSRQSIEAAPPQHAIATRITSERGMAIIMALFMVMIISVLGASLTVLARSETLSSLSYKTMSQARYAAESGLHRAANYLMYSYVPPDTAGDPIASYTLNGGVVTATNGGDVVLTSDGTAANYPGAGVAAAFNAATQGTLDMSGLNEGAPTYSARARLVSMRQIPDAMLGGVLVTYQTWEITGVGRIGGAGQAEVEVAATIEVQPVPTFRYAAFAVDNGCEALKFGGGATTNSYDSASPLVGGTPVFSNSDGNVGTNGNLTELGSTTAIHGSLSTPRTGVGNCTNGNITALTTSGGATVDDGLIELPQALTFPTPPAINPLPPTDNQKFQGGCVAGTAAFCTMSGGNPTIDPSTQPNNTVYLGDVQITGGTDLHLMPGTYIVNTLSFSGNSKVTLEGNGEVIIKVADQGTVNTPVDFTGGAIVNQTFDPSKFQIVYGGTGDVKLTGGSASAALLYAPNAGIAFGGGGDFYGAVIGDVIKDMGGASIHYDRQLEKKALTKGNWTMSSFTWVAQ